MSSTLLVVRLVLAATFAVAGVGKLLDVRGAARAAREFGAPERLAPAIGVGLPLVELSVAAALLPRGSAPWAAAAAVALLGIFLVAIGRAMVRGEHPDCHCFGQIHSTPAGWSTLVRNAALAVLAAFVVAGGWSDPGASVTNWLGQQNVAEVGLSVAVVLLGWFSFELLRQQGRILYRLETLEGSPGRTHANTRPPPGLHVGTAAPDFELVNLEGGTASLTTLLRHGKPVLLVFSDPGCGPCEELLPEVGRWQREHGDRLTIALVSAGSVEANEGKRGANRLGLVLLQKDREVAISYESYGTPSAVLISEDGQIASPIARGADEIRAALASATGTAVIAIHAAGPNGDGRSNGAVNGKRAITVGKMVPDFHLLDVDGDEWSVKDLLGQSSLLLFWNPACGFCQRILDEVRATDAEPPTNGPSLVVVSLGSEVDNRAMGLRAPTLADRDATLMTQCGARGTPSALLVDAAGRVASDLAVGADAVLRLARYRQGTGRAHG
jgi:peroxiredoxin/uncharacterized membrane protein YphA (DoxX/SURF4 family)